MTDYISRADAIEAVCGACCEDGKKYEKCTIYRRGLCADLEALEALPSADAVSRESIMAAKFHPYPFTHITPMDVDAEAYKRGWNDALDAVADNAPSADADCSTCKHNDKGWDSEECDSCCGNNNHYASADAVQGWIPCSERLPSESGDYLCTIPLDADETYTEVLTFHKGRFYEDDDEWGATYHDDVLAWIPLPTPYKGGDTE